VQRIEFEIRPDLGCKLQPLKRRERGFGPPVCVSRDKKFEYGLV